MAAISANPPVRRFFGTGDAHSLKSFHGNSSSPSLKSSSLKTRKSMNLLMPSLLGFKRGPEKQRPDLKFVNSARRHEEIHVSPSAPPAVQEVKAEDTDIQPRKVSPEAENQPHQPDRPQPLRRSKSKALMRMISTTFRPPPSEPGRVPVPPADMASKANREAALRARGLLPPLHPNKDLSRWEQEQDRQLPVIPLAEETILETAEDDVPRTITAASLIKQEWVAKNRSDDTEPSRMKSFKFGGLPSPAPSIMEQATPSTDNLLPSLVVSQKVDEHIPSLPEDEPASTVTPSPRSRQTPPRLILDPHTVTTGDYLLSPHSPATPSKAEPRLIPLPPSPLLSPQRLQDSPISKPADPDVEQMSTLPPIPGTPTTLPAISFSPPPSALLDGPNDFSRSDSLGFTLPSFLSESGSSDMTPSWDNSSQTMTVSSLNTSESLPSIGKPKINTLKVKVHDHHIPIILESPIEETPSKVSLLGPYIDDEPCTAKKLDDEQSASSHGAATPSPTAVKADHKKTKSPVKRGHTLDPSTSVAAKKRLSMLSNVRRSVVGSLSRSKTALSIGGKKKAFDASHLPASPTIPVSFAGQAKKFIPTRARFPNPRTSDVGSATRVAAAPTIHSRGTILDEMRNITDDETRRVTELAFLG